MHDSGGVGQSVRPQSHAAGVEAATGALAQAGGKANLAFVFATNRHNMEQFVAGVRSVLGSGVPLIGGSTLGIITDQWLSYEGCEAVVGVISSPSMKVSSFLEGGVDVDERAVGERLARQVRQVDPAGTSGLLVFYDSVRRPPMNGPPVLNMATPMLEGLRSVFEHFPTTGGAGLLGDGMFNPTFQVLNDRVLQQSAVAVSLSGGVRMDTTVMHGCRPSSGYHRITKTDQHVVLEIDDLPAVEMISKLLGPNARRVAEYPLFITLGLNRGEKFAAYSPENYDTKLVMGIDHERKGLIMFEPYLHAGDEVQLMRRSIDLTYMQTQIQALIEKNKDRKPLLALYIDCAGRTALLSGTEREEAEEVRVGLRGKVPLLGIYTGVEIGKVGTELRALDWTGVLCLLSADR